MTNRLIYIQLTDDGKCIRRFSITGPFDGGIKYTAEEPTDKPMTEPTETPEPTEIPEWAKQRACDLVNDDTPHHSWVPRHVNKQNRRMYALALHVLKHETPPVDPLLLEARERVAKYYDASGEYKELAARIRAGHADSKLLPLALQCLRRGIEIGGGK